MAREQNPRDKGIGSLWGSTWEARRGRQARQLVRGKFCLGPNVTEALGSVLLSPSRWQCVNSDGSDFLDENFAGYRAGRVTAHQRDSSYIGVICPFIESPTMYVLCGEETYPGVMWPGWPASSLAPDAPVHPAVPCAQIHKGLDGGQT